MEKNWGKHRGAFIPKRPEQTDSSPRFSRVVFFPAQGEAKHRIPLEGGRTTAQGSWKANMHEQRRTIIWQECSRRMVSSC